MATLKQNELTLDNGKIGLADYSQATPYFYHAMPNGSGQVIIKIKRPTTEYRKPFMMISVSGIHVFYWDSSNFSSDTLNGSYNASTEELTLTLKNGSFGVTQSMLIIG